MLCDFGISRALLESGSRSNSFKGSLRWMAIELLFPGNIGTEKNPRHSKATDVWAYGMVVYVRDVIYLSTRDECSFESICIGTSNRETTILFVYY